MSVYRSKHCKESLNQLWYEYSLSDFLALREMIWILDDGEYAAQYQPPNKK